MQTHSLRSLPVLCLQEMKIFHVVNSDLFSSFFISFLSFRLFLVHMFKVFSIILGIENSVITKEESHYV